ncbi:hypothetical protein PTKIN_Ptkin05aG0028800 [Pterospermum kingtungense]
MADADTESYIKHQQLVKEQNQANPSKFYRHFLYKAVTVIVFLVIIPVFPSQAPEFINQTILNRSWELLHLLFVGIAVSYGLFSRKNDETEKENINNNNNNQSKFDNVHSFVSRFLQVSSVFDDEAENLSGSDDQSKAQTWSNQYYRHEPPVVVAKKQAVFDDPHRKSSSRISERPLLLPVRSLKSRVLDANNRETSRANGANSSSARRSTSSLSSKRLDEDSLEKKKLNENNNNIVLPSPIPWRSRSGRMEVKDEDIEPEFNRLEYRSSRSQTTRLARSSSLSSSPKLSHSPPLSSSPKKLSPSPSPSLSPEIQAKGGEDLVRKKSIYRSPPPPPPPPPSMIHKSSPQKPNDLSGSRGYALMGKSVAETENGVNGKTLRRIEKLNRDSVSFHPKPTFMEFPQDVKHEFVEKLVMETTDDDDSETEDEDVGETPFVSSIETSPNNEEASPGSGIDGGMSDVNKKADEFIAKVREQIRLQRIDSIKRSSGQMKRNSTR